MLHRFKFKEIFSLGDTEYYLNVLSKIKNDRIFVASLLHHQLTTPRMPFAQFKMMPDRKLRRLAGVFMKKESHIFQYFKETNDEEFFDNFRKAFKEFHQKQFEQIGEAMRFFVEFFSYAKLAEDALKSFSEFWLKLGEILKEFAEKYGIAEQEAIRVLRRYKWCITPSLPLPFVFRVVEIGRKRGNQRGIINKLFVDYFCSNNYSNLSSLVESWEVKSLFKPRMKIFRDCITALKILKGHANPSILVLPVLIAQIDGIWREIIARTGQHLESSSTKRKDTQISYSEMKRSIKRVLPEVDLLNLTEEVLCDILFQDTHFGKRLKNPFGFSRHKIIHGEYFRYGNIDNTLRAFLILDYLAEKSDDVIEEKGSNQVKAGGISGSY